MEYRKLGGAGLKVSSVGIGCKNFELQYEVGTTAAVVKAALGVGINFFDAADVDGPSGLSEAYLGQAISGLDPSQIMIASEFANLSGKVRYIGHSNFSGWQVSDTEMNDVNTVGRR